ncbi:amidohydrolase family protein [Aestuariivita sp.]|jgi:predicted TIM-barrel fold metal-dependent hydrolase|uniref:amidohydrolase family protein n=1 Tax=Aestuariivita sp. TaxID=1872407 RepID=UPI00216F40D0|nr:amidohydrolase family protein [Aestuariivita sp.]MCE8006375.1 amidohydrolase [Aestuariivita sp.]
MPDTPADPPKTQMVNCHVHTFTTDHTPLYFPAWPVAIFRYVPGLARFFRWLSSFTPYDKVTDFLARMEAFHRTGSRSSQRAVFRELLHYYPKDTRFVVLPMDMELIGHGPVNEDIFAQHDGLARLAADPDYGPQVIPFATIYPDRPGAAEEVRRCVDELGFRGLKIYTKLGFAPDHPVLMEEVYPFCVERNIPVMSHCSRGGVYHKGWLQYRQDQVTEPRAYETVLNRFPDLRLCLAHFGGDQDWISLLRDGFDPDDPQARDKNWVSVIEEMIRSGNYPNLYTDISYTIFKFDNHISLLRMYLKDSRLRERVLFGSDFYMTRQEALSEKAVSIKLRDALGEEDFHAIAHDNPRRWLGES